jgi:5-bromo-4-chloroindolyl phosphate hydrolysis protein
MLTTILIIVSLFLSVLNLVILIALANFVVKAAERAAQQPKEEDKSSKVRMSDSGLVDVTTPSPYDGQLT